MGPCPFRHGYVVLPVVSVMVMTASMGPCPFRHGYHGQLSFHRHINMLQWGHALSGMDTAPLGAFLH